MVATWRSHGRHLGFPEPSKTSYIFSQISQNLFDMWPLLAKQHFPCCPSYLFILCSSVADPDPNQDPDPYVFGPPGSGFGSIIQRYASGSFYHQAKIVINRVADLNSFDTDPDPDPAF
jgi:hypothetical protein